MGNIQDIQKSKKIAKFIALSGKINNVIDILMSWETLWGIMITGVIGSVITRSSVWIISAVILMSGCTFVSIILTMVLSYFMSKVEKISKEMEKEDED